MNWIQVQSGERSEVRGKHGIFWRFIAPFRVAICDSARQLVSIESVSCGRKHLSLRIANSEGKVRWYLCHNRISAKKEKLCRRVSRLTSFESIYWNSSQLDFRLWLMFLICCYLAIIGRLFGILSPFSSILSVVTSFRFIHSNSSQMNWLVMHFFRIRCSSL